MSVKEFFGIFFISLLWLIFTNFLSFDDSVRIENQLEDIGEQSYFEPELCKQKVFNVLRSSQHQRSLYFLSKCYSIVGEINIRQGNYDSALFYLDKAFEIRQKYGYFLNLASTAEVISDVFSAWGEDSTALSYLYMSLSIKEKTEKDEYLKGLYNSLGNVHCSLESFDSSLFYYNKSLKIYNSERDTQGIAAILGNIGMLYYLNDKEETAIDYYQRSADWYRKSRRGSEESVPLLNIGLAYGYLGEPDSASIYSNKAISKMLHFGTYENLPLAQELLAESYVQLGEPDSAIIMYQNYIAYRDSVFSKEKSNAIMEYRAIYQTKEAEQQAAFEKSEKEKFQAQDENKRLAIYSLLGAIGLIGIVVFFWRRNSKQKAELIELEVDIKNQEIDNLLKEQEAKSYAALLEGQNTERERIAQDLHDRLGGTLSAVKVHFGLMDQKIEEIKSENRELFDKVNGMLSEAVQDVRRISHDLVSGRIAKLGLRGALEDLANVLSQAKKMDVDFYMDESLPDFSKKKEQEIYAIIQELASNMLKHAQASTVDIQLNRQDELMNVMFEDNGVGFAIEKEAGKGLGIAGLSKRVKDLGGTINYDSVVGRGTIIIINIPL